MSSSEGICSNFNPERPARKSPFLRMRLRMNSAIIDPAANKSATETNDVETNDVEILPLEEAFVLDSEPCT